MAKIAIVKPPSRSYQRCVSSHPLRRTVDFVRAQSQHKAYCTALEELGLDLIQLPPDDSKPDSCFVEDTAIIHGGKAFIARMTLNSRRGEEASIREELEKHLKVSRCHPPETIEGGDAIHLQHELIIGETQRTTAGGIRQAGECFQVPVKTIKDTTIVHLKSHVTYLGWGIVICTGQYVDHPELRQFEKIVVNRKEVYAANTLTIGDVVLMSKGYPVSEQLVRDAGFDIITLDMSEFEKCEGALTCLSILL
jgi:dimethylargininase